MGDLAPNTRDSYLAPATTPRPPRPPTSTGRPRRVGRVSCSTDAKNASMSRCSTHRDSTVVDAIGPRRIGALRSNLVGLQVAPERRSAPPTGKSGTRCRKIHYQGLSIVLDACLISTSLVHSLSAKRPPGITLTF